MAEGAQKNLYGGRYLSGHAPSRDDMPEAQIQEIKEIIVRAVRDSRMTLAAAKELIARGEEKAKSVGVPMVIAVVDEGGNLTALHRMDGSLLASLSIAQSKAYTALALRSSTGEAAGTILPGQPLYGLQQTHPGRFCLFGGGLPLFSEGVCIGAVGVSGGSVDQDTAVAEYAAENFK